MTALTAAGALARCRPRSLAKTRCRRRRREMRRSRPCRKRTARLPTPERRARPQRRATRLWHPRPSNWLRHPRAPISKPRRRLKQRPACRPPRMPTSHLRRQRQIRCRRRAASLPRGRPKMCRGMCRPRRHPKRRPACRPPRIPAPRPRLGKSRLCQFPGRRRRPLCPSAPAAPIAIPRPAGEANARTSGGALTGIESVRVTRESSIRGQQSRETIAKPGAAPRAMAAPKAPAKPNAADQNKR